MALEKFLPKKNLIEGLTSVFGKTERVSLIEDAENLSRKISDPQTFFNYFEKTYPQHPVSKLSKTQKQSVAERIPDMPRLLSSEKGLEELNSILTEQMDENTATEGVQRLQLLSFLESLSEDVFKIPDKYTMENLLTKFKDDQKIAFSRISDTPIREDPNYEYDPDLTPAINGILKVAPTFQMTPEEVQDAKLSLKAAKGNSEIQNLLMSAFLRESPLISKEERNELFFPTISARAIADNFNALALHGRLLLETPQIASAKIAKQFEKIPQDTLSSAVTYLKHFGLTEKEQIEALKKIEPQLNTKSLSELLSEVVGLDNLKYFEQNPASVFKEMEDTQDVDRLVANDTRIISEITGIEPNDSRPVKLNKIKSYLENFEIQILKLNSTHRDKQSQALLDMLNLFIEEENGNREVALERIEDVICKMHDGMYPNNVSKKLKVLIQQIVDVNTNLSYMVTESLRRLTGVQIEKLPPFYMRQQWSGFRIREEIAKALGRKVSDELDLSVDKPANNILDSITKDFFNLLDVREMTAQHDSHINSSGDIPSNNRQQFSEALKSIDNEEEQKKLRRQKEQLLTREIDRELENTDLRKDQQLDNIRSMFIEEFGKNESTLQTLAIVSRENINIERAGIVNGLRILINGVNKPFTHQTLKDIFKKMILNFGYSKDERKRFDKPSLGERVFFFKDGVSYRSATTRFSDYTTMADTLVRSTDAQIKTIARNRTVYPYGQDFRRLFDSFRATYGMSNRRVVSPKEDQESMLATNSFIGLINSSLEYIFNNSPYIENFQKSKTLDRLEALTSLSSLGGLFTTVLSSDSIGYAIMANNGLIDTVKGFFRYFKILTSHIDPKVLRAVAVSADHIFAPENKVHEDAFAKTGEVLNKFFGIDLVDRRGKYALTYAIFSALTNEVMANKMGFMSKRLMEKGFTEKQFNFLRDNLAKYSYTQDGETIIAPNSFDNNPILQEVEAAVFRAIQSVIPSRSLTSKALRFKANSTGIPVFNFVLTSMLRFSGITVEHMYNLSIDQYLRNGFKGTVMSVYFVISMMESALYHFLTDLSKGQVPYFYNKKGEFEPSRMMSYFRRILLDSPNFGMFGGLLEAAIGGNVTGLLGYRALGTLNPVAKVAKASGELATFQFGKAMNTLITAGQSVNPIRQTPILGNLFDRMIVDSLREFVYADADKYLQAIERYQGQAGLMSLMQVAPDKTKKEKETRKKKVKEEENNE